MRRDVVGVLLAAGDSVRFGANKLLQPLGAGETVVRTSARALLEALPDSLAVTRVDGDDVARQMHGIGIAVILSDFAASGMGNSLSCGVRASSNAAGWVIALADMPGVRTSTILAIAQGLRSGAAICAPVYRGRRGHPVGFSREFFEELATLRGDQGARALLKTYAHRVRLLPVNDPGVLHDIDTPEDLYDLAPALLQARN